MRQNASSLADGSVQVDHRVAGAGRFAGSVLALFGKDIRCEMRSRHAVTAMLLFALTSTVAVAAAIGRNGVAPNVGAGLLWVVVYFTAMSGLSRSFVREDEMRTAAVLKLMMAPNAVYLGKLAFNLTLLLGVELFALPVLVGLTNCRVGNWTGLIAIVVVGSAGLSAAGTLAAAMVARAAVKGALYAVVCFPLLAPVLFASVSGSEIAMEGMLPGSDLKLLAYYFGTVVTASMLLFRFTWED